MTLSTLLILASSPGGPRERQRCSRLSGHQNLLGRRLPGLLTPQGWDEAMELAFLISFQAILMLLAVGGGGGGTLGRLLVRN